MQWRHQRRRCLGTGQVKQEKDETLNEYWKDWWISKDNASLAESLPKKSSHIISVPKNMTKKPGQFFKAPLKLRTVLETIELDNYSRKYRGNEQKRRKQRRTSATAHRTANKVLSQGQHGHENRSNTNK